MALHAHAISKACYCKDAHENTHTHPRTNGFTLSFAFRNYKVLAFLLAHNTKSLFYQGINEAAEWLATTTSKRSKPYLEKQEELFEQTKSFMELKVCELLLNSTFIIIKEVGFKIPVL